MSTLNVVLIHKRVALLLLVTINFSPFKEEYEMDDDDVKKAQMEDGYVHCYMCSSKLEQLSVTYLQSLLHFMIRLGHSWRV